jgi:hypothetical protein
LHLQLLLDFLLFERQIDWRLHITYSYRTSTAITYSC